MEDSQILDRISELVAEEHELRARAAGTGLDTAAATRLRTLEEHLDQCWDLLRQREAHEEFHLDPENTSVRDEGTVEGYEQ